MTIAAVGAVLLGDLSEAAPTWRLATRLGKPGFVAAGELGETVKHQEREGSTVVLVERGGQLLGLSLCVTS